MEEYDQENHSFSDEKFMSRKSKKPLMEKRRRARINNCLSQLKSLVLQAMKKDTTHYSKLEKADILEMTVKYLRNLQRRQISSAVAADPTVAAKFSVGFNECATEVARYLNNAHGINEDVRGRLLGHLSNCVQSSNAQSVQMGQAFLQPLHVQIPASQSRLGMGHGQTENLLIAQHSGFTSQIASTGMQVHTSFTVSPDSVFEGNRINSTPSRLNDSSEQKQYQRIHVQCVSSTSNSGNSETQSVLCSRQQTKPCHVYTEPSSPEKVGFRPPVTSTPEYKVPGFSTSPLFASASSALKEEKLWRPW